MISCLIIGAFLILLGASFAFWTIQMQGSRKHIIKAVDMNVTLEEDNDGILISDAVPMYDEVGLIQDNAYQFRLVNHTGLVTSYILKLVDTTVGDKLFLEDVKLGITKNGESTVRLLSDVPESKNIDMGEIPGNGTIYYELRLWFKDTLTDQERTMGKSLSYKVEIEATDTKFTYLSQMKQGDYVTYIGNNGCSSDYCKGKTGCNSYSVSDGWRVAYTEGDRAYLITAGAPECSTPSGSVSNKINQLNTAARKYCNKDFVDGDCQNGNDSWAIGNIDFNRITKQGTGTGGGYLNLEPIAGAIKCHDVKNKAQCGVGNTILDIKGTYHFASVFNGWGTGNIMVWLNPYVYGSVSYLSTTGLRPIVKMKANVFVRSGNGTAANPYVIDTY